MIAGLILVTSRADIVPEGCRLNVVGDGTPAKIGGLQAGGCHCSRSRFNDS